MSISRNETASATGTPSAFEIQRGDQESLPSCSTATRDSASAGRLSILIVNWNSKDYLHQCLRSIRSTSAEMSPQIVVVDGGSFDGCGEMLAAEFPEVEFIQNKENLGFGRSNNIGFERVRCEYLLLLNPDTELQTGAVAGMLEALKTQPRAGIVAPRLLNTDGSLQTSCVQALPTPWNQAVDCDFLRRLFPRSKLWGTWEALHAKDPVEVEAVTGACMLLPSATFRSVGGFAPDYFMYGEDMDLCVKVRRAGMRVYHVPAAVVVHHAGCSSSQVQNHFASVMMRESAGRYFRKHHGPLATLGFRSAMLAGAVIRLAVLWLLAPRFLWKHRAAEWKSRCEKWCAIFRWALGLPAKATSHR